MCFYHDASLDLLHCSLVISAILPQVFECHELDVSNGIISLSSMFHVLATSVFTPPLRPSLGATPPTSVRIDLDVDADVDVDIDVDVDANVPRYHVSWPDPA